MQFPAPDIVVEVLSPSTEKYDRETKFDDYVAHGIKEYWIIDAEHETIEQYFLQDEKYELLLKAKDGTIESVILPEFKIQHPRRFSMKKLNLEELKRIDYDILSSIVYHRTSSFALNRTWNLELGTWN